MPVMADCAPQTEVKKRSKNVSSLIEGFIAKRKKSGFVTAKIRDI
jgi:hypothetical protein